MKIKDFINNIEIEGLNKTALFERLDGIPIVDAQLPYRALGITTLDKILIDTEQIDPSTDEKKLFVILHELCHFLRLKKMTKELYFKNFTSDELDIVAEAIITEEIIADRYACFTYHLLTGELFDRAFTQELEIEDNYLDYKKMIAMNLFKKFKTEEEYFRFVNSMCKER